MGRRIEIIDGKEVVVTVCPPGSADGAGYLNEWAGRRQAGFCGMLTAKQKKRAARFLKQPKATRIMQEKDRDAADRQAHEARNWKAYYELKAANRDPD